LPADRSGGAAPRTDHQHHAEKADQQPGCLACGDPIAGQGQRGQCQGEQRSAADKYAGDTRAGGLFTVGQQQERNHVAEQGSGGHVAPDAAGTGQAHPAVADDRKEYGGAEQQPAEDELAGGEALQRHLDERETAAPQRRQQHQPQHRGAIHRRRPTGTVI
jgi:hypothetical protein